MLADEAVGLVALGFVVAGGGYERGIDGEHVVGGDDVVVVLDVAVFVDGIPGGYGDAEVSLSGDGPVVSEAVGPVGISLLHESGEPLDACADLLEERLLVHEADEPLSRRDVFDGCAALLVVADDVLDGARRRSERVSRFDFVFGTLHGFCGGAWAAELLDDLGSNVVEGHA